MSELEKEALARMRRGELELKEKWITSNHRLKETARRLFSEAVSNHGVLEPRFGVREKHTVVIVSVKGTKYEDIRDDHDHPTAVYVGGPGSMVGAALDSVLLQDKARKGKVVYYTYDFTHSNARSSAYYYHLRHSNALDFEPNVRGDIILREFLRRCLMSTEEYIEDAGRLGHVKIDISLRSLMADPLLALRTVTVLFFGAMHTMQNVLVQDVLGWLSDTTWAKNRRYSQYSTPVMQFLESAGQRLHVHPHSKSKLSLLLFQDTKANVSNAIHVLFTEADVQAQEDENKILQESNSVSSRRLTTKELEELMHGDASGIHAAYVYPEDGRIAADVNVILRQIVQKTGNVWEEGVVVEKVYIDETGVRGVLVRERDSRKSQYQPCSSVIMSLGYTSQYRIGENQRKTPIISNLTRSCNPTEYLTIATGCSGYFLVRGKIPAIGTHNSHWTEVDYSPEADVSLCKFTGGGNIGSEYAQVAYVYNNIQHLKQIFGDRLIGILSVDSCPRVINGQNDVQFYQLAPRLAVSVGLGGTGMTKCGANGSLSVLLSHPELSASSLVPDHPELFADVCLCDWITDRTTLTNTTLGVTPRSYLSKFWACICISVLLGAFAVATKPIKRRATYHIRHCSSVCRKSPPSCKQLDRACLLLKHSVCFSRLLSPTTKPVSKPFHKPASISNTNSVNFRRSHASYACLPCHPFCTYQQPYLHQNSSVSFHVSTNLHSLIFARHLSLCIKRYLH